MIDEIEPKKEIRLTDRQKDILILIAKGLKNDTIAIKLGISANTIKYHKKIIFEQLEAMSASQAVAIAISSNIIHL